MGEQEENNQKKNGKDKENNDDCKDREHCLTKPERKIAAFLFIFSIIITIFFIIWLWPNKPPARDSICKRYCLGFFKVELMRACDTVNTNTDTSNPDKNSEKKDSAPAAPAGSAAKTTPPANTQTTSKDTTSQANQKAADASGKTNLPPGAIPIPESSTPQTNNKVADAAGKPNAPTDAQTASEDSALQANKKKDDPCRECDCKCTIDLSTLLLILVALGGLLGNLIHIASSFTTYVGDGKFKRSWLLWYYVKPFTASALAIAVYFVFGAGYIQDGDHKEVNIYGIMTLAILTGLFSDRATLKLRDIFEVIFSPKDTRSDKLEGNNLSIKEVTPHELKPKVENTITIKGDNLDQQHLTVKINDESVPSSVDANKSIVLKYTVPADKPAGSTFKLEIFDGKGKILYTTILTLAKEQ